MQEDPVISRGMLKALGAILVIAVVAGGVVLFASADIDLGDLKIPTDQTTTTLQDTSLSDTTIGDTSPIADSNPFSSHGFAAALSAVRAEAGHGAQLTKLFINDVQTQVVVRRGDGVEAYSVPSEGGQLQRQDATVSISGNATLADFAFSFDEVKPAAVDRMLPGANKLIDGTLQPTVLALERQLSSGSRELEWVINGTAGGDNLVFRARPDGFGVRQIGVGAPNAPPAVVTAP
ncbi:MAG: hypothetical protein EXQ70_02445 [Solirubrobacterales bacterium]|nr:hypothetical protein [Solirubrobacterales bacterium]